MSPKKKTKKEELAPLPPVPTVGRVDVISARLAPVPRIQARLHEWFRRTPATAARFILQEDSSKTRIMTLDADDAKSMGAEGFAELVYESAAQFAAANERETRLSAIWLDETDTPVLFHPMRLGSSMAGADQFDGSMNGILKQMQEHNQLMLRAMLEMTGTLSGGYQRLVEAQHEAADSARRERDALQAQITELTLERDRAIDLASQAADQTNGADEMVERVFELASTAMLNHNKVQQ